jgi:hypothetical protein
MYYYFISASSLSFWLIFPFIFTLKVFISSILSYPVRFIEVLLDFLPCLLTRWSCDKRPLAIAASGIRHQAVQLLQLLIAPLHLFGKEVVFFLSHVAGVYLLCLSLYAIPQFSLLCEKVFETNHATHVYLMPSLSEASIILLLADRIAAASYPRIITILCLSSLAFVNLSSSSFALSWFSA